VFKYLTLKFCLLSTLLAAIPLQAEILSDLYSAQVKVGNQGEAALAAGARTALGQVLVKASGSPGLLQHDTVKEELRNARNYVQQYAYSRRESTDGEGDELWARFEFSPSFVTTLIKRVGAPLWTANRPMVLVWLVIDEQQSDRYFVHEAIAPDVTAQLIQAFSYRGVPARLPLFDLTDTAGLSLEDAWQMQSVVVQAASSRYDVEDIVVARVAEVSDGKFVGDWNYLRGAQRIERSISAKTLGEFLRQGVGVVAEDMAGRFAVAASEANADDLVVSILGIDNYSDYAAVVTWMENLELVENATVARIEGGELTLRLQAQADAVQLSTLIELNRRLEPVPGDALNPQAGTELRYQWKN
jgi:uncharacterized protein